MDDGIAKFNADMKKAEKLIIKACEKTVRGTAIAMFGEIIRKTPVGNPSIWKINANAKNKKSMYRPKGYVGGRLRNNWQATINSPAEGEVQNASKSGSDAKASVKAAAASYDLTKSMFLTNNLPYAARVEYGQWSKQAPQGMMRTTVASFKSEIEKNARGNKV